jgi:hypothetical protein
MAGPPLRLTGNDDDDRQRRRQWRRMYAAAPEPLTPRERELRELRHRPDVLDDAIALERDFAWRRTRDRLAAVGVTAAPSRL